MKLCLLRNVRGLVALVTVVAAGGWATAADVKSLGANEAVLLTSLQQQLADIDDWTCSQFKEVAWKEVGEGLYRRLTAAAEKGEDAFKAEVTALVEGRFRGCLDQQELKKFRDELARLKDDKQVVGKGNPITLRADVMECLLVIDAGYPGLVEQAKSWSRKDWNPLPGDSTKALDEVVKALHGYQRRQRLEAKVRLLASQPAWVLDALGQPARDAIQKAAAQIDKAGRLASANSWKDRAALEERANVLAAQAVSDEVKALEASLAEASAAVGKWFEANGRHLLNLRVKYEEQLRTLFVDSPPDWQKSKSSFIRATLTPADGGRLEARLSVCRPLPEVKLAIADAERLKALPIGTTPPVELKAEMPFEQVDLGITLTRTALEGGRLVPLPSGIGADLRIDRQALVAAVRRLGVPGQFGVDELQVVKVADDGSHVSFRADLSLPGLPARVPLEVRLSPAGISAGEPLTAVLRPKVAELPAAIAKALNALPAVELATPAGKLKLTKWQATGDWGRGAVEMSAEVSVEGYGAWTVPIEFYQDEKNKSWSCRVAKHNLPGRVLDALLVKLRGQLTDGVEFASLKADVRDKLSNLPKFAETFGRQLSIDNASYDPATAKIKANARWLTPPTGVAIPAVTVTLSLSDAKLTVDGAEFTKALKANLAALVEGLLKDLIGDLTDELTARLVKDLVGKKLDLFAASLEITEVGAFDKARLGVPVKATVAVGSDKLKLENLWLLGLKLPVTDKFEGLKADFSQVSTDPELGAFVRKLFAGFVKVPDSAVEVSGVRFVPQGIVASVALRIDALGSPLPVGDVTFGLGGVRAKPDLDALLTAVKNQIAQRLAKEFAGRVTLPDLGPVKDLQLDEASSLSTGGELKLFVKGKLALPVLDTIDIPFSGVQVFPKLDLGGIKLTPPSLDVLKGAMNNLFQFGDANSPVVLVISAPEVKQSRPYGITFNVTLKALVFQMDVGRVSLTQNGLSLPERVAVRFPGYFPIGPLAFVNPGIGISLNDASKIDILGDLTFASPGVDKIVAIRSSLTADVKNWTFNLEGRLVLLSALAVFEVKGEVKLRDGTARLTAKTLPPLDKVLSLSGEVVVDGPALCARTRSDLAILGLKLVTLELTINGRPKGDEAVLHFAGRVNLLLGEGEITVDVSPDLSRSRAKARVNFGVGGFDIAGADLAISTGLTKLQFRVVGFKVTVIVSTVSCLTPKLVLDVILSLFDFDPVAFFKAISRGEVVVNLVDRKGQPVDNLGEGNPLPGGGPQTPGETKPPGGDPPLPPGTDNKEGKPAAPASQYPESNATGWNRPAPPGEQPKENRPSEVYTYQPGNSRIEFVKDTKDPQRFVEVTTSTDGKFRWEGHFSVDEGVKNELKKDGAMIISSVWLRFPAGVKKKCRNGFEHDSGEGYLVLERGGLFVAGMFPDGGYQRVEVDLSAVGPKLPADKLWEQIVGGKRPLTSGDMAALADLARAKAVGQPGANDFRRVVVISDKPEEDGYIYSLRERPEGTDAVAVYQSRGGGRVTISVTSPFYPLVVDPGSQLTGPVCQYLADAAAGKKSLDLLAVEHVPGSGGQPPPSNPADPLKRPAVKRLLVMRSEDGGQVWIDGMESAAKPTIRSALLTTPPPRHHGLTAPLWQPGAYASGFSDALMGMSAEPKENEVRHGAWTGDNRSAAFGQKLDGKPPEWKAQVVIEREGLRAPGGQPVVTVKASKVVTGETITKRYGAWQKESANVLPAGVERFKGLDQRSERQALLDVVIGPAKDWPTFFASNPLGLFVP